MDRTLLLRALALYVPILLATILGRQRLRTKRHIAAIVCGLSWALPSLLLLQVFNVRFHWWSFHAHGGLIRGAPVDLWLGWAILWGVLPVLIFPRLNPWLLAAAFVCLDLVLMPRCAPLIELSNRWLVGEMVAVCMVLLPALFFARWTWDAAHLNARVLFQVLAMTGLLFFFLPEIIFALTGRGSWQLLFAPHLLSARWAKSLELQTIVLLAIAGASAAQELARRGLGTPLPFDPPQRLVCSGLYRYVGSPMQISGALVLMAWGLLLQSWWLFAAGPLTFIYSAGLAGWHENENMLGRFGERWLLYRRNVPKWRPRWKPWHDPIAPIPWLYIAEECGPCSEVRRWFEARRPVALEIVAAEDHPTRNLTRITYDPMDGTAPEEGVAAFARALEHINLAWAYTGVYFRLPVVRTLVQLLIDAGGLGPKMVERRSCSVDHGLTNDGLTNSAPRRR